MNQLDLFAAPPLAPGQLSPSEREAQARRREGEARARATDPGSSHEAARAMNESGKARAHREMAVDMVWKHPGNTSRELAGLPDCPGELDRYELARRLPEAECEGQVKKGPKRKCKVAGTLAVTWRPGE
jgi:hypothetical protein